MTGEPPQIPASDTPAAKPQRSILTAAKGSGILFGGRIAAFISRFAITFILARFLAAEDFGMYSLARMMIPMAAIVASFGLDTTLVRFIALLRGQGDEKAIWGTIQVGLGTAAVLGLIIGGAFYLLAEPVAVRLFDEPELTSLLRLSSLFIPFATLGNVISTATRGFKTMQYSVIATSIVQPLTRLILIIILIAVGLNAPLALLTFGLAEVVTLVLLLYFLNHLFSFRRPLKEARYDVKAMFNFGVPVYLTNIIQLTRSNVQTILLGSLSSVTSVGIFTVANRINLLGQMFISSISTSVTPIIAELYGQDDLKQLEHLYQAATKWIFTLNLPIFLIIISFPDTILSLFGESFTNVAGATTLVLLAWANMVDSATGICGQVLDMTGYTKLKLLNSVVSVILSVSLNLVFISKWGMVGAAVTAIIVIGVLNTMRLIEVYALLRLLPYNFSFWKPIAAALVTLATITLTASWLPEANLIYDGIQTLILMITYTSIIFMLGISAEDQLVLGRLRQRTGQLLSRK